MPSQAERQGFLPPPAGLAQIKRSQPPLPLQIVQRTPNSTVASYAVDGSCVVQPARDRAAPPQCTTPANSKVTVRIDLERALSLSAQNNPTRASLKNRLTGELGSRCRHSCRREISRAERCPQACVACARIPPPPASCGSAVAMHSKWGNAAHLKSRKPEVSSGLRALMHRRHKCERARRRACPDRVAMSASAGLAARIGNRIRGDS